MDKNDSIQLKGIAILMMVWLHLFSEQSITEDCINVIFFKGRPLAYMLTKLCACCVSMYAILGGYGLSAVFSKSQGKMNNGRRALLLMTNFWIVCLLFIPMGCIFRPDIYPGDWPQLLLNISAVSYSYNGAWWFLLPYVLITLCSGYIVSLMLHASLRKEMAILLALLTLHVGAYMAKDYLSPSPSSLKQLAVVGLNVIYLLFMFSIGVAMFKHRCIQTLRSRMEHYEKKRRNAILVLALIGTCVLRISIGNSALINLPFSVLIIMLFSLFDKPHAFTSIATFLGQHSTNVWLCHYFFLNMLFQGQVYALRYPLAIFIAVLLLALASSYLIKMIFTPIRNRMTNVAH